MLSCHAILTMARSVCLSVTGRYCVEMAERIKMVWHRTNSVLLCVVRKVTYFQKLCSKLGI